MMKYFLLFLVFGSFSIAFSQSDSLRAAIAGAVNHANGHIGVAVMHIESKDTVTMNGNGHFPMQSVFKFPLALAVLNKVDSGKFSLGQSIHVTSADLLPNTWSPLKKKYPEGNVDLSLDEILSQTVSMSDNNGCDILFRLIGGTAIANSYIHSLGIDGINITATEEEMHRAWDVQYQNWSTPVAMMNLLYKFYTGGILSKNNTAYLWNVMVKTTTGTTRLKGLLPEGTVVGHKTGSSDTNEQGMTAASNDVGIVTLLDGTHVIIVVFVSNSYANDRERDNVIAGVAKAAWDTYVTK